MYILTATSYVMHDFEATVCAYRMGSVKVARHIFKPDKITPRRGDLIDQSDTQNSRYLNVSIACCAIIDPTGQ